MRRPFLTIRLVIFVLALYLNILAMGFGAWNTIALKQHDLFDALGGAPVFIIVNACFYVSCLFFALVEIAFPTSRTAQVSFECGWTGVMSILHLAAAIDITILGPPEICSDSRLVTVCASSTVLVALSWIICVSLTGYFLFLTFTALSHMEEYGGIWSASVTSVPWFVERNETLPPRVPLKNEKTGDAYENPVFAPHLGLEAPPSAWMPSSKDKYPAHDRCGTGGHTRDSTLPNWARKISTRRGIDPPFQTTRNLVRSWWLGNNATPPTPPPKPINLPLFNTFHTTTTDDQHDGDALTGSRISYGHFPRNVSDPDLPIEFRHLSEWVQAREHTA